MTERRHTMRVPSLRGMRRKTLPLSAFSLVEVLIGTCVLLFLLFPPMILMQQGTRLTKCARMQTQGAALLQSLVEDFRAMSHADLRAAYYEGKAQPLDATALLPQEGSSGYFATVELVEPEDQVGLLYANFTLTWVDAFGHLQARQYHTRFCRDGLSDQLLRGF